MSINILDCTLRDGGYVNNWNFPQKIGVAVLRSLERANIDIVECGYLSNKSISNQSTLFKNIDDVKSYFGTKISLNIVIMINYGDFDIDCLPNNEGNYIYGIRLAFHKKDIDDAISYGKKIVAKGYKLFIQPMVTKFYSDIEFINLIKKINEFNPYAFYIVDSFGSIDKKEFLRYLMVADHELNNSIVLGFHGHNNMQFVFANAVNMIESITMREIIIDSSVLGMGRGAGNLNTEVITDYLNKHNDKNYKIEPLLGIMDDYIETIYKTNQWGFTPSQYLSAKYNCHPNYAAFLVNKKTLNTKSINYLLEKINKNKVLDFDKEYIEQIYLDYLNSNIPYDTEMIMFPDKDILVIASGPSVIKEKDKIHEFIDNKDPVIISINHESELFISDYVFFSNQKRYDEYSNNIDIEKCIITSNVETYDKIKHRLIFSDLYQFLDIKSDNSTILLLCYLAINGVTDTSITGLDGYTNGDNYYYDELIQISNLNNIEEENMKILDGLSKLSNNLNIDFITDSQFKI